MVKLDDKWLKSGLPQVPDASVDPSTAPFATNLNEDITARTMRNFAFEIDRALEQISDLTSASWTYTYRQVAPALVWEIIHNLGFRPAVELIGESGFEIEADVQHLSDDNLRVTFTIAQAGYARLT